MQHITLADNLDPRAELANGISHLVGVVLSLMAMVAIVLRTSSQGNTSMLAGGAIYGTTMLLLYFSSSMYHLVKDPVLKRIMRIMDHATIYFLIAGTYTPVMMFVGTGAAMLVLSAVWGLTVIGIVFTLFFWGRYGALHVIFYIVMGWLIIFVWDSVVEMMPSDFIRWAIAGGVTYTAGTLVYGAKFIPYFHAIWHLFVIGGSACFFVGIYFYLM